MQKEYETHGHEQNLVPLSEELTIGQIAHLSGVSPKTIRYYESIAVLPQPHRDIHHSRRYSRGDLDRLLLLRRLRSLGVPLAWVKSLPKETAHALPSAVLHELLALLDERAMALEQEKTELERLRAEVEAW